MKKKKKKMKENGVDKIKDQEQIFSSKVMKMTAYKHLYTNLVITDRFSLITH